MAASTAVPADRFFQICTPGAEIDRQEFQELLVAYAHAMWAWSRVENKLFLIFAHAVEPTTNNHSKALRAAFFSIVTAKARLDMLHSVARAMWEGKRHWQDWLRIHEECGAQLRVRGRLAHLVGYGFIDERKGRTTRFMAVLAEPMFHPMSPKRHSDLRRSEFTAASLSALAADWALLNDRLGVFVALAHHEAQPEASSELSDRLSQLLQTPGAQTRKERALRKKPSSA